MRGKLFWVDKEYPVCVTVEKNSGWVRFDDGRIVALTHVINMNITPFGIVFSAMWQQAKDGKYTTDGWAGHKFQLHEIAPELES